MLQKMTMGITLLVWFRESISRWLKSKLMALRFQAQADIPRDLRLLMPVR
jgi:hypothetical protein